MYYTGTRSSGGKYPCPMCLVPNTELSRLKKSLGNAYTIRTARMMREVYEKAIRNNTGTGRDMYLKNFGLHDVQVCICLSLGLSESLICK